MVEYKYEVTMNDVIVAEGMTLEIAMILEQGLFEKYFAEPDLRVGIQRYEKKA